MVYVLYHFPEGFARTRRNLDGALTDFAYRAFDAICARLVEPTARALKEFFERNKDTANKALRLLEDVCGYVHRWKKSGGGGAWLNFAIVTDEPYAWERNPAVRAKMADLEQRALARFQDRHRIEPHEAAPPPPEPTGPAPAHESPYEPPAHESVQVSSCPDSSDPTFSDTPNRYSSRENSPLPPDGGQVVHKPSKLGRQDNPARVLDRVLRAEPELEPHLPPALALLHALDYPPLPRARGAVVLARALRSGRTLDSLITWLTVGFDGARDEQRVRNWRIDQLAVAMDARPVFRRSMPSGRHRKVHR